MPKEVIQRAEIIVNDGVGDYAEETEISVVWKRDCFVQVGIKTHHKDDLAAPGTEIFSDFLTRSEINKMIATLRKSRDQAFGRYE